MSCCPHCTELALEFLNQALKLFNSKQSFVLCKLVCYFLESQGCETSAELSSFDQLRMIREVCAVALAQLTFVVGMVLQLCSLMSDLIRLLEYR